MVEIMGGEVGVRSEVGAGSVFWVRLPIAQSPPRPRSREAVALAMSSGRILIADDEPSVRDSVSYALEQEGFDVTLAIDGDDADTKLEEHASPPSTS